MQEHQLLQPRFRSIQAHFQAPDLAVHHFFIVGFSHIEQPAPGAAQRIPLHRVGVVVQDVQGVKALSLEVGVHLVGRGPPVIVVSLHDQLLAGKLL